MEVLWRPDPLRIRRLPLLKAEREIGAIMVSRLDIETSRLNMLEARMALEDNERLHGAPWSLEHTRLTQAFTKATSTYLKLSASQR